MIASQDCTVQLAGPDLRPGLVLVLYTITIALPSPSSSMSRLTWSLHGSGDLIDRLHCAFGQLTASSRDCHLSGLWTCRLGIQSACFYAVLYAALYASLHATKTLTR